METFKEHAWKLNAVAIIVLALSLYLHNDTGCVPVDSIEAQLSTQIGFRNASGDRVYRMRTDGTGDNSFNFSDIIGIIMTMTAPGDNVTFLRTIDGTQVLVNGTAVWTGGNLSTDIVPSANRTYNVGSPEAQWNATHAVRSYVNETCYTSDCSSRIYHNGSGTIYE